VCTLSQHAPVEVFVAVFSSTVNTHNETQCVHRTEQTYLHICSVCPMLRCLLSITSTHTHAQYHAQPSFLSSKPQQQHQHSQRHSRIPSSLFLTRFDFFFVSAGALCDDEGEDAAAEVLLVPLAAVTPHTTSHNTASASPHLRQLCVQLSRPRTRPALPSWRTWRAAAVRERVHSTCEG
jgi:hypothetical protein